MLNLSHVYKLPDFEVVARLPLPPLFLSTVQAGFPSPADDYIDQELNLHELLVSHPAATFFVKAQGHSMTGAGIFPGDLLVVDRSLRASDRSIVIAVLDGEFLVKRLRKVRGKVYLVSENPEYKPIEVSAGSQFEVWGVVTHFIHSV
ncbi:MAG TPA: translesion error-prone DNA polymerase V autoproteolytic subunit [Chloroflexia bacterium]|nr:translesion error-prone DNA polymerase V autoproteolytic subunit [Chloroflexia bacterium]